jgi:hypothetical protein
MSEERARKGEPMPEEERVRKSEPMPEEERAMKGESTGEKSVPEERAMESTERQSAGCDEAAAGREGTGCD